MTFYTNISRVFRFNKFFKSQGEKWQGRRYVAPIQFYRSIPRSVVNNFESSKRAVKTILILSYKPQHQMQIYGNNLLVNSSEYESILGLILIVARIFVIGSVLTGLAIVYFVTRFTHRHVFPKILRRGIEFLGPIFIKFGQWASTRKDLFPKDVCRTLSQLQQSASAHSWIYTKQLLKAIYGSNWRDIFVKFEHEMPIGSGCCGQVYKAWVDLNARVNVTRKPQIPVFIQIVEYLKFGSLINLIEKMLNNDVDELDANGDAYINRKLQPVAVKILHPGIKGQLRRDLFIMRWICKCATYIVPQLQWLSLTDCIDEFSQIMEDQVDMNLEAQNLLQFSKNFSKKKDVIFPRPYTEFTQCEVLVESFHEGSPISDYLDGHDTKLQGKLAKIGIKTILKMVFKDNFIHCDLHPGNILVQTNCEPTGKISTWFRKFISFLPTYPRIVILDCGLVVSLNDRCRRNLKDVFRSVLMGNGELAAEHILKHSSCVSSDPEGFKSAMKDIVNSHLQSRINVSVSTVVTELFSAMVRHRVKQDGTFSSVILSMVVIEGLGRSLDPNIDIFTEVVPFIFTNIVTNND
ncbi:uncharacterized aarF domain-containing protein kinase 2-like [Frieseomelitta varia]|uniref:uncharacterized aarF domain-containing protein kinase 2-like n=1 Tax=Frieseomelitta varia TaxID=561572 RepID=UPI001CB6B010|nr:uncharacterized aarF domain-containing protein kinase 2-like [Frieseomelitta varia]